MYLLGSSLAAALPAERRVSARRGWAGENGGHFESPAGAESSEGREENAMMLLQNVEYLNLGRQIARLLGSSLEGASADALRELALAHDPSANDARISAEVFLFHKFLLMQACVGVFPESHVEHVVGGFFAALNEKMSGLELGSDRQQAMEQMWQLRAGQFEQPFLNDRTQFLDAVPEVFHWKQTISRFCQNVREIANPPDIWAGISSPSLEASRTVTHALNQMISTLNEMNRLHFSHLV
jgi:hypothetical protein